MKLSEWAKQQGISYTTAWRWFKAGTLPVSHTQLPSGTILVHPPKVDLAEAAETAALYARVSDDDQKSDLDRQLGRLATFATNQGMVIVKSVSEIGSGVNNRRPELIRLLADPKIRVIVVEHRDRLMRFGSEYIESTLVASERKLIVVDESERKDDLIQDMIELLTSFCTKLYGRHSAKNRALNAISAIKDVGPE